MNKVKREGRGGAGKKKDLRNQKENCKWNVEGTLGWKLSGLGRGEREGRPRTGGWEWWEIKG